MESGCDTTIALPKRIGRYSVSGVLGNGAMGTVYLGYDDIIDRKVAIKTIHRHLLAGEHGDEWLSRFRQEVRAAGRCLHPNIVTIFEYGEQDGAPYIVMEYVQGQEVREYLMRYRLMPLADTLPLILQVLQALGHAHAGTVVHRDIKPSNIILLPDGRVKVADFGIARLDAVAGMTQVGLIIGTPSYMSPEQFLGLKVDRRTDLFAAAVVFFELLTGSRPFPGTGSSELMFQVLNEQPRRATLLNPGLPACIDALFDKALAKDPNDRFQHAEEFIAAVQNLLVLAPRAGSNEPTLVQRYPDPAPPPTQQTTLSGTLLGWDPVLLEQMVKQLTVYLGPVAKVLVRKTAQQAGNPAELIRQLAAAIPGEADRLMFQRQMKVVLGESMTRLTGIGSAPPTPTKDSQMSASLSGFDQTLLEAVRRDLAVHLGPIAKVLVRQAAAEARTLSDLYERLAVHIPDAAGRAAFLRQGEDKNRTFIF
jgi:serine/threonine-protein kinase